MATLIFTQQLCRFTEVPEVTTSATTLREALEAAFVLNPRLKDYVLDEQGHLRFHVTIFIDGNRVRDHVRLDDVLKADSKIHVLQALSGG
ncbi:MAG: MoaD/ThiS family protein [Pseudomonadota bacterium]